MVRMKSKRTKCFCNNLEMELKTLRRVIKKLLTG